MAIAISSNTGLVMKDVAQEVACINPELKTIYFDYDGKNRDTFLGPSLNFVKWILLFPSFIGLRYLTVVFGSKTNLLMSK